MINNKYYIFLFFLTLTAQSGPEDENENQNLDQKGSNPENFNNTEKSSLLKQDQRLDYSTDAQIQKNVLEVESTTANLEKSYKEMQEINVTLKNRVTDLEFKVSENKIIIEKLHTEVQKSDSDKIEYQEILEKLAQEITDLEQNSASDTQELKKNIEILKQEKQEIQESLNTEQKNKKEELQKASNDFELLKEELNNTKNLLNQTDSLKIEIEDKLKINKQKTIEYLKAHSERLKNITSTPVPKIDNINEEIKQNLEKKIKESAQKTQYTQKELENNTRREQEKQEFLKKLNQIRTQKAPVSDGTTTKEDQCPILKQKISLLQNELNALQENFNNTCGNVSSSQ
ncbi:hypothetical protein [Holospora curviuscula]|uniref:Uncharacterized protein n=1 Tax=Holospora curviuscula TaxID=1082868 RepID=A0A2S5RA85_9PROT|nr:hypothetical protein [Holospora curviuscula]PPE04207.1 hypothetical protein HCUR_00398 [Holospora curviuscula]